MRVRNQLDGERAHALVEQCLNELRGFLEEKGLIGRATGSRRFLLRYLGMQLLRNTLTGRAEFLTTYSELRQAWAAHSATGPGAERGIHAGTDDITPKATFQLWTKALRRGDNDWFTMQRARSSVRLRFHRPSDDVSRIAGDEGDAGIEAQFFYKASIISVRPATTPCEPKDEYWTAQRPIAREDQRAEQVDRILGRLRTTLNEESSHVLDLLDAHPGRLTYDDSFKFWNRFKTVTKRAVAVAALLIIVSFATAILTAPPQAQAALSRGWNELRAGIKASYLRWCPGCDDPKRKYTYDSEKPEAYYTPGSIRLSAKQYAFAITAHPSSVLPFIASTASHAEAVADPSEVLRVRMSVSAREHLRRGDTKYYINFGDDPTIKGGMNKMIAVGPSAIAEHVFPRPGTYVVHVTVALRASGDRGAAPPLPPSESDLYSTAEFIKIMLRVGDAAPPPGDKWPHQR